MANPESMSTSKRRAYLRFLGLIKSAGMSLVGEYVNGETRVHLRCPEGHDVFRRPDTIKQGRKFCRACAGITPGQAEIRFRQAVAQRGGTVVGEYVDNKTSVKVLCQDGHACRPRPDWVVSGGGFCLTCAGYVFDVFYVVTGPKGVKFGVTSGDPRPRLRNHSRDGYTTVERLFIGLSPGMAHNLEQTMIKTMPDRGHRPVRGREYYGPDSLTAVLALVDAAMHGVSLDKG